MSNLPQLVGLRCVTCDKEIHRVTEGRFCRECGNPVHVKCYQKMVRSEAGRCTSCSGDPTTNSAEYVCEILQRNAAEQRRKENDKLRSDFACSLQPVAGEVLRRSIITTVWVVLGCILGIFAGCSMFLLEMHFLESNKGGDGQRLAFSMALPFICLFFIIIWVWRLFVNLRIIIGRNSLQIVKGAKQIVLHVPYDNIDLAGIATDTVGSFLGIKLIDPTSPSTYHASDYHLLRKPDKDWDYHIAGGFAVELSEVLRKLLTAMRENLPTGGPETDSLIAVDSPTPAPTGETFAKRCPICGDNSIRRVRPEPDTSLLFHRECRSCGTVWRPAVPRWAAWTSMSVGGVLLTSVAIINLVLFAPKAEDRSLRLVLWIFGGILASLLIGYGALVLVGIFGRWGLIREGRKEAFERRTRKLKISSDVKKGPQS